MTGRWTLTDKLAALVVFVLAAGYAVAPIRVVVVGALTGLLAPLSVWLPFSALVVGLGGLSGVTSALARRLVRDADRAERARDRVEELRERLADANTTPDADDAGDDLAATRAELRSETLTALAENLRPAVYSAAVTIPAFLWLRWVFTARRRTRARDRDRPVRRPRRVDRDARRPGEAVARLVSRRVAVDRGRRAAGRRLGRLGLGVR